MKLYWRLLKLLAPYGWWMMLGIFLASSGLMAGIALMGISGWFITSMGLAGVTGAAVNYFTPAALIRGCAIVRTAGRYAERLVTHDATLRMIAGLRRWFYEHLIPLAPRATGFLRQGDMLARLRGDIDVVERFYLGFLVPLATALIAVIVLVLAFGYYSGALALIMLGLLMMGGLFIPVMACALSQKKERALVDQNAALKSVLSEDFQAVGELLVYDTTQSRLAEFTAYNHKIAGLQNILGLRSLIADHIITLLTGAGVIGALVIGLPLLGNGALAAPELTMLVLLALASFEAVMPLPSAYQGLGAITRAAQRIFDMVDQKPALPDPAAPAQVTGPFHLAFTNVSFAYEGAYDTLLHDLTFDLKAGQKMALIGPTGSGKSSLVHLLMRFWGPEHGQITLNGRPMDDYAADDIRAQFAVLSQDPYLFNATLKENLLIARPDASQSSIQEACQKAGLHEFITSLPDGYDSYIGEHGRQLSGGQVQRLALARALLKDAPCLILDEPAEGLDYKMERDILERVMQHLDGRALILITHRRAGLKDMDFTLNLQNNQGTLDKAA